MHCRHCGASLSADSRFCSECGAAQQLQTALPQQVETRTQRAPTSKVPTRQPARYNAVPAERWSGRDPMRDDEYRRFGAATRSFTTPAIFTLILYLVFWLPGFIANVVYWREANNLQRITGRAPEGKGCLVAMLWLLAAPPLILFLILIF